MNSSDIFYNTLRNKVLSEHYTEYISYYSKLELGLVKSSERAIDIVDEYDYLLYDNRGVGNVNFINNFLNLILFIIRNEYKNIVIFYKKDLTIYGFYLLEFRGLIKELFSNHIKIYLYEYLSCFKFGSKSLPDTGMMLSMCAGISEIYGSKVLLLLPRVISNYITDTNSRAIYLRKYEFNKQKQIKGSLIDIRFNESRIENLGDKSIIYPHFLNL